MRKFFSDFKKFISKGNIVDLAIAVVIGGAFSKIVTSLVNDIIMPLIGLATGGRNVNDFKWVIKPAVYDGGVLVTAENSLKYGMFLQTIIDFLIIAFFIFLAFRIINGSRKKLEKLKEELSAKISGNDADEQETEEAKIEVEKVLTPEEKNTILLGEIRDLLKADAGAKEVKPATKKPASTKAGTR